MPLPPALAARLARRGILSNSEPVKPTNSGPEVEEEVFAEDYDNEDTSQQIADSKQELTSIENSSKTDGNKKDGILETEDGILIHETLDCPNKWNPYHTCIDYCKNRWGYKKFKPDPDMDHKRKRMLRKYPLPDGWKEVADPETGRYYYWNTMTEEISWLAPLHPKAKISVAEESMKELLNAASAETGAAGDGDEGMELGDSADESDDDEDDDDDEDNDDTDDDFEKLERELLNEKRRQERNRKGRRKVKDDALDPMDPASYSDIPRGSWSAGLETKGDAKTGVDATASGPLFQQRPYPSPGAVLRANQAAKAAAKK